MSTKQTVIEAVNKFADNVESGNRLLRETVAKLTKVKEDYEHEITGLRSIEASLQADLTDKRNIIQAQSERIVEIAAYRDELKEEVLQLRKHVAADQKIVNRNLEMVKEITELKERNAALESRCFALDSRVIQQKEELDGLRFALHKAGL